MEIEQSALWRDVERVLTSPTKPVNFYWAATIHTPTKDVQILKITNIDFIEKHLENVSDEVTLEGYIPGGKYAFHVFPGRENLEITLMKVPTDVTGSMIDTSRQIQEERFRATLIDASNPVLEGGTGNVPDEEGMDLANLVPFRFQLQNKAIEQLRMIPVGGIFRYTTVEDAIRTQLSIAIGKLDVDLTRNIQIDMVPPNNDKSYTQIIIPHGTMAIDVPDYIQSRCGGVYSAGLSHYIKGGHWYVYPSFDFTRFDSTTRTVDVILVAENKLPSIERTYLEDGTNVTILATGQRKFNDDSEGQQLNRGNGVRFADATQFMGNAMQVVDGIVTARRGHLNTEAVTNQRQSGNNNVLMSDKPITGNSFQEYSKMARREGSALQFVWENSNMDTLKPGTQMRIQYLEGDYIEEVFGVVIALEHAVMLAGIGGHQNRYYTNTAVTVFIKR